MVQNQIHDNGDTSFMRTVAESIPVFHSSEFFHDREVIRNIVTVIHIRRSIDRRHPYCIDAKLLQIIQLLNHSLQITDSIIVAIFKTSWVNLVDHQIFIPVFFVFHMYILSSFCINKL